LFFCNGLQDFRIILSRGFFLSVLLSVAILTLVDL
jgi:hypothetical protein